MDSKKCPSCGTIIKSVMDQRLVPKPKNRFETDEVCLDCWIKNINASVRPEIENEYYPTRLSSIQN